MIDLELKKPQNTSLVKEYHLDQYTYHIHFQGKEEGACLRASEVKPKLDRFIYELEKNGKLKQLLADIGIDEETLPEKWKNKSSDDKKRSFALNYKMSISGEERGKEILNDLKDTAYFGNMGAGPKKKFVLYKNGLTLTIICKNDKLLKFLDHILPAFFMLNCFGTRSTKGFGSYGIKGWEYKNDDESKTYIKKFVDCLYYIESPASPNSKLPIIKTISNMMKGGINFRGYYKGRIFVYFTTNGTGSDKAFIKQNLLTAGKDTNRSSEEYTKYTSFVYSRAMLGLADQFEYRSSRNTTREGKVSVKDGMGKIARFNNPIHFIPNNIGIIILPTKIPDIMMDYSFTFEDNSGKKISIKTPKVFDLIAFMDYFRNEYNKVVGSKSNTGPQEFDNLPKLQLLKIQ